MNTTEERIKALLALRRKTPDDLAEAIGKNRTTVYRYLNGHIENMPSNILKPMADYLQTNPAYLMGWIDDPRPADDLFDELLDADPDDDKAYRQYVLAEEGDKLNALVDDYIQLDPEAQHLLVSLAHKMRELQKPKK